MATPIVPEERQPARINGKGNPVYFQRYYAEHKAEDNARSRQYRLTHAAAIKVQRHDYYVANSERIKAQTSAYGRANPEQRRIRAQRYRAAHPEAMRALKKRKQARRRGAPVHDLTAAQWREIKAAYEYRCVYCGRKMQHLTQDHITPLSKGGSHTASNIVPACRSCNSKKRAGGVLCPVQPLLLTLS